VADGWLVIDDHAGPYAQYRLSSPLPAVPPRRFDKFPTDPRAERLHKRIAEGRARAG